MSFVQHKMAAMIVIDPTQAKKIILAAFVRAKASRTDTAKILGIHHSTLIKWAIVLGIRKQIDAIEARALREGWRHTKDRVGRPKKKDRAA